MSVAYQDYYQILEVGRGATQAEIQKAYRKLARKYHPDVSKEKGAEDKFKKATEAYEVLKNADTRKKYDQLGSNWKAGEPFSSGKGTQGGVDFGEAFSGTGFSSFFDALFGSQGKKERAYRSDYSEPMDFGAVEQEATIEVSLEEAFSGVEKEIIIKPLASSREPVGSKSQKRIKVRIPPGAIEASKIRLKGQGRSGVAGGRPGDLILKVRLKPHPIFHAEKYDVIGVLKLAPWEAALGAKVSVATLGKSVTLTVAAGTQGGHRLRLKGKGLPRQKHEAGDIYYEVKIAIPEELSDEERQHFEALARISKFQPRA